MGAGRRDGPDRHRRPLPQFPATRGVVRRDRSSTSCGQSGNSRRPERVTRSSSAFAAIRGWEKVSKRSGGNSEQWSPRAQRCASRTQGGDNRAIRSRLGWDRTRLGGGFRRHRPLRRRYLVCPGARGGAGLKRSAAGGGKRRTRPCGGWCVAPPPAKRASHGEPFRARCAGNLPPVGS